MCGPENVRAVLTPPRFGARTVRSTWRRPSGREKTKKYIYICYIYPRSEGFVCLVYFPAPRLAVWLQAADLVQFTPARSDRGDTGGGGDVGRGEGGGLVSPDSTSVLPSGHAQVNEHTHTHTQAWNESCVCMWRMMRVGGGRADNNSRLVRRADA